MRSVRLCIEVRTRRILTNENTDFVSYFDVNNSFVHSLLVYPHEVAGTCYSSGLCASGGIAPSSAEQNHSRELSAGGPGGLSGSGFTDSEQRQSIFVGAEVLVAQHASQIGIEGYVTPSTYGDSACSSGRERNSERDTEWLDFLTLHPYR